MEVKIGVCEVPRELVIDTSMTAEELQAAVTAALIDDNGVLAISEDSGGKVLIPASRLGYVQLGGNQSRHIGFSST